MLLGLKLHKRKGSIGVETQHDSFAALHVVLFKVIKR